MKLNYSCYFLKVLVDVTALAALHTRSIYSPLQQCSSSPEDVDMTAQQAACVADCTEL